MRAIDQLALAQVDDPGQLGLQGRGSPAPPGVDADLGHAAEVGAHVRQRTPVGFMVLPWLAGDDRLGIDHVRDDVRNGPPWAWGLRSPPGLVKAGGHLRDVVDAGPPGVQEALEVELLIRHRVNIRARTRRRRPVD